MSCLYLKKILQDEENITQLKNELVKAHCAANYWKALHKKAIGREILLKEEIETLKAKLRLREKQLFGKKSEKSSRSPLQTCKKPKKRGQQKSSKGHGRRDYLHLPVVNEYLDIPENQKICPRCNKPYRDTGLVASSKVIEVNVSAHVRHIHRKCLKRSCNCTDRPKTITAPVYKIIPKGILGNSIWAHILMEKFGNGIPLHRILHSLSTINLPLASGTIIEGFHHLKDKMAPIYEAIRRKSISETNWHIDETGWRVFEDIEEKKGYKWWLWVFKSTSAVVYILDPTRSSKVLDKYFSPQPSGIINCDRYKAYIAFGKRNEGILLAFCWAHVRRDFLKIAQTYPQYEKWAMEWIEVLGKIFHINKCRLLTKKRSFYDKKLHIAIQALWEKKNQQLKNLNQKIKK